MTERHYPATGPLNLLANIAQYPSTAALRAGQVPSDLVRLEMAGPKLAHEGFQDMLRRGRYDVSEMAIATFLQARALNKPVALLPVAVLARFQHRHLAYNAEATPGLRPRDLAGRRVAVRSYSQTTGLWIRALLQHDHGVAPESVRWVCFDPPHLAEMADPADCVEWAPPGTDPGRMLQDGLVDAAILGFDAPADPRIQPLFGDPDAVAADWYARSGFVPPNHYVIVPKALCDQRPDAVREIWRMLVASCAAAPRVPGAPDTMPVGIEANRRALEHAIRYATEQRLLARPLTVDDLFDGLTASLG